MSKSISIKCLGNGIAKKLDEGTLYFLNENQVTKLSITYPTSYADYEKWIEVDINGVIDDIYLGTGDIVTLNLSYEYFQCDILKLQPYVFGLNSEKAYWNIIEYEVKNTISSTTSLINSSTIVTIGDTIKIIVEFKTINGSYIDPINGVFNVYDCQDAYITPIYSQALGEDNKISIGVYEVYYTIPDTCNILYFEFKGDNDNEKMVYRGQLKPKWLS